MAKKYTMIRKNPKKISYFYSIYEKNFPDEDKYKAIFGIKKCDENGIMQIPVLVLFQNDKLLEKFSPRDIRDIVYTAAWELFLREKEELERLKA